MKFGNSRQKVTIRGLVNGVESAGRDSAVATKADIDTDLTLEIDGSNVTPEKFLRSVRTFFAILTEVTREVGGRPKAVEWRVNVKQGSNLVQVAPQPGFDPALINIVTSAVGNGISQLENIEARPDHFNERALKNLRELGSVVGRAERDDTIVKVWVRRDPIRVTEKSAANVSGILASEHEDYGSIEGRLQTVTERGRLQFIVYEQLWDKAIRCYMPDHLTEAAMGAFRARVEVYGLIRYRKDGQPISIFVDELVKFPPENEIPSFQDVHGILRQVS